MNKFINEIITIFNQSQKYEVEVLPRIWVDFNNLDTFGRVRLNTIGTLKELNNKAIHLTEGLELILFQDEIEKNTIVDYSEEENIWVGKINE